MVFDLHIPPDSKDLAIILKFLHIIEIASLVIEIP